MYKIFKQYFSQSIRYGWNSIVNIGIHPAMSFIESRRTRMINLLAIPCIPFFLFFAIRNIVQERYLLSGLIFLSMASSFIVLVMHKYRMYLGARLILIVLNSVIFTITGLYFHNGSEYFLLNILIITMLVYDNKWITISLGVLILTGLMLIIVFPQPPLLGNPIPEYRVWRNILAALIFLIIAIDFFKYIHYEYQRKIEEQQQELMVMNRDKEKLLSIVAHDIKGPISSLESLLNLFREGLINGEDMEQEAAVLHEKVANLRGTLDNILRWSTSSMQGIQTSPRNFLLLPIIEEAFHFFELILQQKNISLNSKVADTVAIYADRDQVALILRNLISNALKFSYSDSEVVVTATVDDNIVTLCVSDCGTGMDDHRLKALFETSQNPAFGTVGERGSGLGLILCKEFIRQNNGKITVSSILGKGTTCSVSLQKGEVSSNCLAA